MESSNVVSGKIRTITFSRRKSENEPIVLGSSCDIVEKRSHPNLGCSETSFPIKAKLQEVIENEDGSQLYPALNKNRKTSNIHSRVKKHKCETCHEKFTLLTTLNEHQLSHGKEKSSNSKYCISYELPIKPSVVDEPESQNLNVDNKQFECWLCDKIFPTSRGLKRHQHVHEVKKKFECFVCQRSYSDRHVLEAHVRAHTREQLQCNMCPKSFLNKSSLTKHKLLHIEKPHECKVCHERFGKAIELKRHVKTHGVDKAMKCEHCKKVFYKQSHLEKHEKVHSTTKSFECNSCHKIFLVSSDLKKHIKIHTGEKPYKCSVCFKHFSVLSNLRRHERLHTGVKPFQCDTCHKQFSEKAVLEQHIRVHTGERPYECEVCGKRFTQNATLIQHRRIHTGNKRFSCEFCSKQFYQKGDLNKHLRVHTGERPFECDECHKRFIRSDFLKIHKRIHVGVKTFLCEMCPKAYMSKSELTKHKKAFHQMEQNENAVLNFNKETTHNTKALNSSSEKEVNEADGNRLSPNEYQDENQVENSSPSPLRETPVHKVIHVGKKTYQCRLCLKQFLSLSNMKRHEKLHAHNQLLTCEICKTIMDKSIHAEHMKIHTSEKHLPSTSQHEDLAVHEEMDVPDTQHSQLAPDHSSNTTGSTSEHSFVENKPVAQNSFSEQQETVHAEKEKNACEICGNFFASMNKLGKHRPVHAPKIPAGSSVLQKSFLLYHSTKSISVLQVNWDQPKVISSN